MNAVTPLPQVDQYARVIRASKAVHWDIDTDVIRGRTFDTAGKFLPDGLSLIGEFSQLTEAERRFASQIQGRTYANVFGLVERFITAKLLEVGRDHWLGDQSALEALVRFSDEELKHQALFRRVEGMMGAVMPSGYRFDISPDQVARAVLSRSTWAVLLLTLHIELFVQLHYRQSIAPDAGLSELFRDVFLFHWKDEVQHVVLDELELRRHDATLTPEARDRGVDDFIALVSAVDGILQIQARADADYLAANCTAVVTTQGRERLAAQFLKAYRWQYILSGAAYPRFRAILGSLVTEPQARRIESALRTLQPAS
jgi:hypothetical protein